ncbi:MAG TPA: polysaccharide biosynthesis/export family protein [Opitutus sp.]|nr:polysaccharide biosynthesis/export family protein [Opitutus sp.]
MKTVILRIIALVLAAFAGGCATPPPPDLPQSLQREAEQILHAGDVLKIAFPGAPNLDSTQQIRRDGKLNLPMVGEVVAADRTPADLQTELRGAYSKQLLSGDVTVTVVSSPFTVFVAGAVLRPGKIAPERAITALEAVMEAGGFDNAKANPRAVVVIRNERDTIRRVTLDLQALLDGRQSTPFYLKAYDIVYVPEKFSFF